MLTLRLEVLAVVVVVVIVVVTAVLVVVPVLISKLVHLLWACSELIWATIAATHLVYEILANFP